MSGNYLVSAEVDNLVASLFIVEDKFRDGDTPNYIVSEKDQGDRIQVLKESFKELADKMRPLGYLAEFRWIVGKYYVTIKPRPALNRRSKLRNQLLIVATFVTVFIDGYLRSNNPVLTSSLMAGIPVALNALLFTISIMAVFGVHELGHKFISDRKGIRASLPYFIPAPPGMGGTFGAVISQDEPPTNRDDLFDLGIAGPLAGLIATILVGLIGISLSYIVPFKDITLWMITYPDIRFQQIPMPLLLQYISNILKPTPQETVLIMHPVAFAAWVGCLVTSINLVPSWQLDGGHIVRSIFGHETHKIVSIAGIFLLIISGYVIMAVIIAFFMMRENTESIAPLDDVSPISLSRKITLIIYIIMMGSTLVILRPF